MSGGTFDYKQYTLHDIADQIERLIATNESVGWLRFKKETIEEFDYAVRLLNICAVYLQRIDWLVAADEGEELFHERLEDELKALAEKYEAKDEVQATKQEDNRDECDT